MQEASRPDGRDQPADQEADHPEAKLAPHGDGSGLWLVARFIAYSIVLRMTYDELLPHMTGYSRSI